jgi:Flp pilus assembly pilin Flp
MRNQKGQGLVEYTLIVVLVSLVFWTGVKNTKVGSSLQSQWGNVRDCVALKLTAPDCRLSGGGNNGGGNGGGNNGGGNNGGNGGNNGGGNNGGGNNGGGNGGNNH